MEKIISPLTLSLFSSMRQRLGVHTQPNEMLVAQQEDVTEETGSWGLVVKWRKSPRMEREVGGQAGMEEAVVRVILFHNQRLDEWQQSSLETPRIKPALRRLHAFCFCLDGFFLFSSSILMCTVWSACVCVRERRVLGRSWSGGPWIKEYKTSSSPLPVLKL